MEEIRKITLELTPEEYKQIERKSIYNNSDIDDYIINKTLDRDLRNDEERRTETIRARVTPRELQYIENKIKGTNFTMSEFLRRVALDKDVLVVDGVQELAKQLRGIGKNLNQLTMLAHKGLIETIDLESTEDKLDEIWKVVNFLIDKNRK